MKKGQSHPAALTSKKLLSSALIKLMDKKEYEYISITELCEHSQVSRRTFYRNFNKIDDIIIFIAKSIINEFVSEINKHSKESFYDVMISFFSFRKMLIATSTNTFEKTANRQSISLSICFCDNIFFLKSQ